MYCQSCGTENQAGLNYCNRCGAQVNAATAPGDAVVAAAAAPGDLTGPMRWLAATICLTMLIGFGVLSLTVGGLAGLGIRGEPLVAITFFGLAAIFGTEFMLIRMMSRLLTTAKDEGRFFGPKRAGKKELKAPAPQQFIQPSIYTDPLGSVTEHTTRAFGPSYKQPRA
jgi:predicted lipid-binding transport protein (Tim44 family)